MSRNSSITESLPARSSLSVSKFSMTLTCFFILSANPRMTFISCAIIAQTLESDFKTQYKKTLPDRRFVKASIMSLESLGSS